MNDRDFLSWIYERLEHVHGESPLMDYMHKLRSIIEATPRDRETLRRREGITMQLHRYDYDEIDGKMVRVRRDEIYVWSPVNMETGEVSMEEPQQFNDGLRPLAKGWEWKRFTMTLGCTAGQALPASAGSGKFRRLAIELGGVVESANDALWNCMELSHGQALEFNEAKLHSALADIRYRMDAVNRILPNEQALPQAGRKKTL